MPENWLIKLVIFVPLVAGLVFFVTLCAGPLSSLRSPQKNPAVLRSEDGQPQDSGGGLPIQLLTTI